MSLTSQILKPLLDKFLQLGLVCCTLLWGSLLTAQTEPVLTTQTLISDLNTPWDMAFSPDGAMFFTLRSGVLRVRLPSGTINTLISQINDLNPRSQSGLLGIAVDPAFSTNRFIYLFLSSNRSGSMDNRVRKFQVNNSYTQVTEIGDILTGINWGSDGGHSGGRIRFGPDGYLYVTTGDTRTAAVPQNRAVLGGKILRITTSGNPAPSNPNLGNGTRPEIFAWGFRNPQGITFEPETNRAFICEHGPNFDDEVTWIQSGGNGGWDPNDGNGNYIGYSGISMTDLVKFPNALKPAYKLVDSSGNPDSAGMSGCTFLNGNAWGSWNGALVVGLLEGASARLMRIGENGVSSQGPTLNSSIKTLLSGLGRLRSLVQGPDNALYVAIDNSSGRILRISPSGIVSNTPTVAPTSTSTKINTPTPTPSRTSTSTVAPSRTVMPSLTPTSISTSTATIKPTNTLISTFTPTVLPTPTLSPTIIEENTKIPTPTNTIPPSHTVSVVPDLKLPIRIDSGSTKRVKDLAGKIWDADNYFLDGQIERYSRSVIAKDNQLIKVLRTARNKVSGYSIPLPNGLYRVILRFIENSPLVEEVNDRIFNLRIENFLREDFDIFFEAGGKGRETLISSEVEVNDGLLNINFEPIVGLSTISAIEIRNFNEPAVVRFFTEDKFKGSSYRLGVGEYFTVAENGEQVLKIKSIFIPNGYKVTLCSERQTIGLPKYCRILYKGRYSKLPRRFKDEELRIIVDDHLTLLPVN
jgi:aldose sugar dehydrogenase